jgi:hypothetical protein
MSTWDALLLIPVTLVVLCVSAVIDELIGLWRAYHAPEPEKES